MADDTWDMGRWILSTSQSVQFEVVETTRLLDPGNPQLKQVPGTPEPPRGHRLAVLDEAVEDIFGSRIRDYFASSNTPMSYMTVPAGDEHKTIEHVLRVASRLNEIGTEKFDMPPIAFGGGVVQDIVGLATTLYRSSIPYVRVPTTLLGQIDSSVSARSGVNFEGFRNRLGTFNPPSLTFIDRAFIATLPKRHIRSGLGQALKMALIKDPVLFRLLEEFGPLLVQERLQDTSPLTAEREPGRLVMHRAIDGMAAESQKNLWEKGFHRIVDYGHAVEMEVRPIMLHGEAATMGSLFCAVLSLNRGLLCSRDYDRIIDCVQGMGLLLARETFGSLGLVESVFADAARHRVGVQHLTLLTGIGKTVFVEDLTDKEIKQADRAMQKLFRKA
ncbi:iron-containing alcohol dehydrogenase [Streptomyces sp. NPDC127084]|uniref:3-dehydroquinate synthase family protein n=1 Tax=Streptomyces sp. NPDC127084 TaxID=3347133 RepID=UPI0036594725